MPQISKIRIVNCNYNDGNRLIPDELYDLSSPETGAALNSLFNLNNGGGKTVLVQLMMQPVNPKAMAGGRRIEDYFVRSGDHAFVLIEWNKDGSKEKLLTGIAIAASQSTTADEERRGNTIKYYTFKTEYTDFSPYSISALDLSKNENGRFVPEAFEYVREKAKTSKGALEFYSSDDSVKWANMLADYGIYRSEWESVIETLNKDEGGLNQYFDDAKTSDKLIAKFFIPAIEQKMNSVSSKEMDSSLETMLINYARKITNKEAVIQERDTNRRLLASLNSLGEMSDELYSINDTLISSVKETCGFKAALSKSITGIGQELERLDEEVEKLNVQIRHIEHEEKSKAYYEAQERLELSQGEYEKAEIALAEAKKESERIKHEEDLLQCAKLYKNIEEAEGRIVAIKKEIAQRENDSDDAEQISKLKYSVMVKAKEAESEVREQLDAKGIEMSKAVQDRTDIERTREEADKNYKKAEENYNQIDAELKACRRNTDRRVVSLGLSVIRQFDGFFSESEIESEKKEKEKEIKRTEDNIACCSRNLANIEKRLQSIPEERAEIKFALTEKNRQKQDAEAEFKVYKELLTRIVALCDKHSLNCSTAFSGRLSAVVNEELERTKANISRTDNELDVLEERLRAAGMGHVHILPQIMEYIVSTGINCQTGEEYLCKLLEDGSISNETLNSVLSGYPEIAYSILFFSEKDLQKLLSAGNVEWIPAAVPLFTMEQVNLIFRGEMSSSSFLAVFDKAYFVDRAGYLDKLQADIADTRLRLDRYKQHREECTEDCKLVEQFVYPSDWQNNQEDKIIELQKKIASFEEKLGKLEQETAVLQEERLSWNKKLDENKAFHNTISKWLEACAELMLMMNEEASVSDKLQDAYKDKNIAKQKYDKVNDELEKINGVICELEKETKAYQASLSEIQEAVTRVDNAKEDEIIAGEWRSLFSQYKTLCDSMNSSLEELRVKLDEEQGRRRNFDAELANYSCERSEYQNMIFTQEALKQVKTASQSANEKVDSCQNLFTNCSSNLEIARYALQISNESLVEFESVPLPKHEIGGDYKRRSKDAKLKIKSLSEDMKTKEKSRRDSERLYDQVDSVLDEFHYGEDFVVIELADLLETQWKSIKEKLICSKENYAEKKQKLLQNIRETVKEYKDIVLAEIVGKLSSIADMLENTGIKGERLFTVSDSIGTMLKSIEKINSKIETDLKEIENDFNDIVDQCMNQGKRMYNDLRMIASSSKAHIFEGKPQTQMVRMELPEEKEISEEASRVSIKSEIEHGANEIKVLIKNDADIKQIQKRAKLIVSSERMLHKYISQETIPVKVYKIDINSENSTYKRWEDTLTQNSGAEKFVVFFAVVLVLMNYTRSTSGMIDKNAKSVLILDNPFGKITSAHLLRPMFDIAKHFNVQLICLSDINKSDVINCFDNVIKLVIKEQNLSNRAIMTHEGNERIEHGYYKIMNGQMSLF